MEMTFKFNQNYGITDVAFEGLSGREYVTSPKEALNIMKIRNPILKFSKDAKAGNYSDLSEEEYEKACHTLLYISELWHPSGAVANKPVREMSPLMLLANAIERISELDAELRKSRGEL